MWVSSQYITYTVSFIECIIILLANNPINLRSSWKISNYVSGDAWIAADYDDSKWHQSTPGSMFPIIYERYYRIQKEINSDSIRYYSAFELYITHLYNIEVYLNGRQFISRRYFSMIFNNNS